MSYILDAIKKSDQQRQRGATPTLQTPQTTIATTKKPALFFYGLLAVILICAGIVIGIQRPWQSEPHTPANKTIIAKQSKSNMHENAPITQPRLAHTVTSTEKELHTQKPATIVKPGLVSSLPATTRETAANTKNDTAGTSGKNIAHMQKEEITPVTEKTAGVLLTNPPQEQKVMTIAELPPAIQQEIPKMAISVHVYSSKPKDRLVGINERLLREGDDLIPGLKLEQITHEDMVFGYKGFHFRRSVQ